MPGSQALENRQDAGMSLSQCVELGHGLGTHGNNKPVHVFNVIIIHKESWTEIQDLYKRDSAEKKESQKHHH